jgi:hypothetical protein
MMPSCSNSLEPAGLRSARQPDRAVAASVSSSRIVRQPCAREEVEQLALKERHLVRGQAGGARRLQHGVGGDD